MSEIADLVRRLVEAGATPEAVAIAVEAASVTRNVTQRYATSRGTELSMTPGAIRSRRHREKVKQLKAKAGANDAANDSVSEGVTQRHAERSVPLSHCLTSIKEETSEEVKKERKKDGVSVRARGTRLAPDAELSPEDRQFAIEHGVDPDAAWVEFRDYWTGVPGQRGVKLTWSGTWRNRVRDLASRKAAQNGKTQGNVLPAIDRLVERVRAFDQRPGGIRDGTGARPVRLLSEG